MNTPSELQNVLVIGASSSIAQACVKQLLSSDSVKSVITVSRKDIHFNHQKLQQHTVSEYNELTISQICQDLHANSLDLVISTIGILHDHHSLAPEKKIEDIATQNLQRYFAVNTIIPALWLKHLIGKMKKDQSNIILLSARVGSISDNRLGGWYGYRASKAALNMLVKTAQVEYQRRSPGCELVLYHPGTVDSPLSKPFQRNVKPENLFTPEFTASQLFDLLNNKPDCPPPYYIDWQHQSISW